MRCEEDINTAQDMKSICRAALLNVKAPDSELYRTRVRVNWGPAIFVYYSTLVYQMLTLRIKLLLNNQIY